MSELPAVYLTSFNRSRSLPTHVETWSGAVYQPNGFDYPKAEWADIRKNDGTWIRPREFLQEASPLDAYRRTLLNHYASRGEKIREWLNNLAWSEVALCCWCPYDRAAQRQLNEFGSFVCHLTVIGEYLSSHMMVPVWYDAERRRAAVLEQKAL